jgi:hypothetical protein
MKLNSVQLQQMHDDGYLVLKGMVPRVMVDAARQAINHHMGEYGMPPDELNTYRAQTYCRSITREPVLTDLFNKTPVFAVCEQLVGEGNLLPASSAQIALRFPRPDTEPQEPRGHIDGQGTGTNGIPRGEFARSFTMLAVVLLSDLPKPYSGNFTVWPGTHRQFETVFKEKGPASLADGIGAVELCSEPVQITGEPGDVVITHHQLVHTAVANSCPDIRYAAIFRGSHKDAKEIGVAAMTDIWREWCISPNPSSAAGRGA